ncbi:SPRY domain-containing SOCS box protein 3 isoform X4 [Oratosquilla oratoria]|uniref:SPRY domain-containing SOCS box protein 3 isoform X4 n=1 Tax=Oratosquilla oratoria TaxID=337810 RepID=UPI003F75AC93
MTDRQLHHKGCRMSHEKPCILCVSARLRNVQSNSFCSHIDEEILSCACGEDETEFCWVWGSKEGGCQAGSVVLCSKQRQIHFNPEYSSGTAAVRGAKPLEGGFHHYWELKMTSAVYGTDLMVGVGTNKCDLSYGIRRFCSLLGRDRESWGYSYSGIAFMGLQHKELFPIVSSTSARSGMKLVSSCAFPVSLQFLCAESLCLKLRRKLRLRPEDLGLPPGLRAFVENNYWWFLRAPLPDPEDTEEEEDPGSAVPQLKHRGLKRPQIHWGCEDVDAQPKRLKQHIRSPHTHTTTTGSSASSCSSNSSGSTSYHTSEYSSPQMTSSSSSTGNSSVSSISSSPTSSSSPSPLNSKGTDVEEE